MTQTTPDLPTIENFQEITSMEDAPQNTHSFESLLGWLESFQSIGEKGGWKFILPEKGMPEQLAIILKLHMTGQTT